MATAKDSDGTADGESQAAADEDSFEMVSGVEQTV